MNHRTVTGSTSRWVEHAARIGYAAKGIVYVIIGAAAVSAAFGSGGDTKGPSEAIRDLADESYGPWLLGAMAIGLLGYSLWRFVQAVRDPEHEGRDASGALARLGYAVSGTIYLGLAFLAASLVFGWGRGGGSSRGWVGDLVSSGWGRVLLGIVGVAVAIFGCSHFVRAFHAKFMRKLALDGVAAQNREIVKRICQLGLSARGVTLMLIGAFLVIAAWQQDASEAQGTRGALQVLGAAGPWLLGVIAAGLVAYGAFCFANARYRRIPERV